MLRPSPATNKRRVVPCYVIRAVLKNTKRDHNVKKQCWLFIFPVKAQKSLTRYRGSTNHQNKQPKGGSSTRIQFIEIQLQRMLLNFPSDQSARDDLGTVVERVRTCRQMEKWTRLMGVTFNMGTWWLLSSVIAMQERKVRGKHELCHFAQPPSWLLGQFSILKKEIQSNLQTNLYHLPFFVENKCS